MSKKKKEKSRAHAEMVWEREQIAAAAAAEKLDKSMAVVELHKDELTEQQYTDVLKHFNEQRQEIKLFLLKARDKYVSKVNEFGLEQEDLL